MVPHEPQNPHHRQHRSVRRSALTNALHPPLTGV
jgi:hypothetical protein